MASVKRGFSFSRCTSGVQKCVVNAFLFFKEEAEEENVCLPKSQIIDRTGKALKLGSRTVRRYIDKWEKEEELKTPDKKRTRSRPITDVDNFTNEGIARIVYKHLLEGHCVTVREIFDEVKKDENLYFSGSESSLRRILKKIGFEWGKGDSYAHVRETEDIMFRRTIFLREYIRNNQSENSKLVVFLDETWIFVNGKRTNTWMDPSTSQGIARRPDEGSRIVLLNAGSKEGFVPGVGLIFNTKLKTGQDYHGAMDGQKFEKWVKELFIPALRNLGPCLVVMDNASYHSRLLDPNPTTRWRKNELIVWLRQQGVCVPENANVPELRTLCKIYRGQLKRYVVDEMLKEEGHQVLRTPPYHCMFNAIENVWSETKRYYNKNVVGKPGQGFERSKAVWAESLDQVTAEKWKNYANHTEKLIVQYYEKEVKNVPEVDEIIIDLQESDPEESDHYNDNEEELAEPLPVHE